MAEREGLLKTIPGFHPAGALRATKFVPDKFVKPSVRLNTVHSLSRRAHSTTLAPLRIRVFVCAGRAAILGDVVSFGNVVQKGSAKGVRFN